MSGWLMGRAVGRSDCRPIVQTVGRSRRPADCRVVGRAAAWTNSAGRAAGRAVDPPGADRSGCPEVLDHLLTSTQLRWRAAALAAASAILDETEDEVAGHTAHLHQDAVTSGSAGGGVNSDADMRPTVWGGEVLFNRAKTRCCFEKSLPAPVESATPHLTSP